jgi:rhodanese-related sulfurtransferase
MNAISTSELRARLSDQRAPLVIDVRRRPAFQAAGDMIAGALRRDPEGVGAWAANLPQAPEVVVYCVHGHEVSQKTAAALAAAGLDARFLEGGIEEGWKASGGPLDRKPQGASTRWVTRERPKIDRIACPCLFARFIDPEAEFLYVPASEVMKRTDATPYDVAGAHFGHEGEQCSFDAFLKHYRLADPGLDRLATIVRAADTSRPDLAPEAPGLLAISSGLSRNFADDYEMLRHGMVMYDALYAWCRQRG